MTIKQNNPVRQAFAACSTGAPTGDWRGCVGYYKTKGHAVRAFDGALARYDLSLVTEDANDFNEDSGRATVGICGIYGNDVGRTALAVLSWHRMSTGHYEFVGYIS